MAAMTMCICSNPSDQPMSTDYFNCQTDSEGSFELTVCKNIIHLLQLTNLNYSGQWMSKTMLRWTGGIRYNNDAAVHS